MDITTGEIIKRLRLNNGLTQSELAAKTNLTRRMICAIELGESNITAQQIKAFSQFFNVSADYLLFGKDMPTQIEMDILKEIRNDKAIYSALIERINVSKKLNQVIAG